MGLIPLKEKLVNYFICEKRFVL